MNMFGIRKVTEGDTVEEKNIPLDINYRKLLDWLVERKQVPENWTTELDKLEKEIEYAKSLLPENIRESHLNGDLWYNPIELILRDVEKEETGWTGSTLGRAWRRVMKHLKYKKLFLAHSSRLLLSMVNYEIPSLNKRLERSQKQLNEHQRKEQEYIRICSEERALFQTECSKYGIQGAKIHEELSQLVTKLPEHFAKIYEVTKEEHIERVIEFYENFVQFLSGKQGEEKENLCPVLAHVLRYGNESVDNMRKRMAGEEVEEGDGSDEAFVMVENEDEPEMNVGGSINWGDDDDDIPMGSTGDIQWDIEVEGDEEVEMGNTGEIEWDIDVSTPDAAGDPWEIEVEDGGIEVTTNTQEEEKAPTENILEYSDTRNQFLDDLLELQSFLRQRLEEMKAKENMVLINLLQKAPKHISGQPVSSVESMLESVNKVNDLFNDITFRMIIEIKASSRYTERLETNLKRRLETANRMEVLAAETKSKQQEVEENIIRLQLQKVSVSKEAAEIKAHLQTQLSNVFGRPVNIMGDIHTILAL